jgi:hypothetical protein
VNDVDGVGEPKLQKKLEKIESQVEEAFTNLKGDLSVRPIYYQLEQMLDVHSPRPRAGNQSSAAMRNRRPPKFLLEGD